MPNPRRISLPTYPFAKERYWVKAERGYLTKPEAFTGIISHKGDHLLPSTEIAPIAHVRGFNTLVEIRFFIQQLVADITKIPINLIDANIGFLELGVNSAGIIRMTESIKLNIDPSFLPTTFFEYTTIDFLSKHLSETYRLKFELSEKQGLEEKKNTKESFYPIGIDTTERKISINEEDSDLATHVSKEKVNDALVKALQRAKFSATGLAELVEQIEEWRMY